MLSKRSLETLIDLVEIKLSCIQVLDRDDAREQANLENCLRELGALDGRVAPPEVVGLRRKATAAAKAVEAASEAKPKQEAPARQPRRRTA